MEIVFLSLLCSNWIIGNLIAKISSGKTMSGLVIMVISRHYTYSCTLAIKISALALARLNCFSNSGSAWGLTIRSISESVSRHKLNWKIKYYFNLNIKIIFKEKHSRSDASWPAGAAVVAALDYQTWSYRLHDCHSALYPHPVSGWQPLSDPGTESKVQIVRRLACLAFGIQ